jgi:hypothetical protein
MGNFLTSCCTEERTKSNLNPFIPNSHQGYHYDEPNDEMCTLGSESISIRSESIKQIQHPQYDDPNNNSLKDPSQSLTQAVECGNAETALDLAQALSQAVERGNNEAVPDPVAYTSPTITSLETPTEDLTRDDPKDSDFVDLTQVLTQAVERGNAEAVPDPLAFTSPSAPTLGTPSSREELARDGPKDSDFVDLTQVLTQAVELANAEAVPNLIVPASSTASSSMRGYYVPSSVTNNAGRENYNDLNDERNVEALEPIILMKGDFQGATERLEQFLHPLRLLINKKLKRQRIKRGDGYIPLYAFKDGLVTVVRFLHSNAKTDAELFRHCVETMSKISSFKSNALGHSNTDELSGDDSNNCELKDQSLDLSLASPQEVERGNAEAEPDPVLPASSTASSSPLDFDISPSVTSNTVHVSSPPRSLNRVSILEIARSAERRIGSKINQRNRKRGRRKYIKKASFTNNGNGNEFARQTPLVDLKDHENLIALKHIILMVDKFERAEKRLEQFLHPLRLHITQHGRDRRKERGEGSIPVYSFKDGLVTVVTFLPPHSKSAAALHRDCVEDISKISSLRSIALRHSKSVIIEKQKSRKKRREKAYERTGSLLFFS